MKSIEWTNRARKQLKKIPREYQEAIGESVQKLVSFPDCEGLDVTALKNHRYGYRMRVGRYRVLFNDDVVVEIITIEEVKKRDERTY